MPTIYGDSMSEIVTGSAFTGGAAQIRTWDVHFLEAMLLPGTPLNSFDFTMIQFGPFPGDSWLTEISLQLKLKLVLGSPFTNMNFTGSIVLSLVTDSDSPLLATTAGTITPPDLDPYTLRVPVNLREIARISPLPYPEMVPEAILTMDFDRSAEALVNSVCTRPSWNRYLIFSLYVEGYTPGPDLGGQAATAPTFGCGTTPIDGDRAELTVTEVPYGSRGAIPGHSGPESGRKDEHDGISRLDRCPKCGNLSLRATWVRDGFSKDLMVCPPCWDEEDPDNFPRRDPRDTDLEGEYED